LIGEVGRRGWGSVEGVRWRRPAPTAGARAPARTRLGVDKARPREVLQVLRSVLGAQVVMGTARGGGAPAAAAMARRAVGRRR
jgi:hypothetical protein